MPAKRMDHPSDKKFLWQFPLCGHETDYAEYDSSNYNSPPPTRCPKCGRSADETACDDSLPASIVADLGFPNCPGCGRILTASDVVRETETEKVVHCVVCDYEGTVKKQGRSAKPARA
jgi:transcription elongation factor Elf1